MRAYSYLRVSGAAQCDGDGFPRQLEACLSYARTQGIEIVDTFREEGVSGTKDLEHRPALQALLTAMLDGDVRMVIIEKLDRLARDLMIQETILADLQKHGVSVVSVAEPDLCSTDPSRVLVRQIFGAIAQYDRAMTVLKLRGARERAKARDGHCEGAKPYGTLGKEAGTLVRMTAFRSQGMTYRAIAESLNSSHDFARDGGAWSAQTVGKILLRQDFPPRFRIQDVKRDSSDDSFRVNFT